MADCFSRDAKDYHRNVDPIRHSIEQYAHSIHRRRGCGLAKARAFAAYAIRKNLCGKQNDPKITFLERQSNGDRIEKVTTIREYIYTALKDNRVIAPSGTTYKHESEERSFLSGFIRAKKKKRKVYKTAYFAAKALGDLDTAISNDNASTAQKLANNGISGAQVSPSTPLYNKTGHSTLTSTCRITAGYGNCSNEKLLRGNRHYHECELAINNIWSIVSNTDYDKFSRMLEKYKMHIPTVNDVMECILYSTNLYWMSEKLTEKIRFHVESLNGLERAAFLYTGDLYHIAKHNKDLVRTIIGKMSQKIVAIRNNVTVKDMEALDHEDTILAHHICYQELRGKGFRYQDVFAENNLSTLYDTTKNITNTVQEYSDFFNCFLASDNVPGSVSDFPHSVRRCVITGDTDSTIFTAQWWVNWYFGYIGFSDECRSVGATMIYLANKCIRHLLALMSINLGVHRDSLFEIAMKNEFFFDIFNPTNVAKHYMSLKSVQEGNVFAEIEEEIKGVHLKSSAVARSIVKRATKLMIELMMTVRSGQKIKIIPIFQYIASIEREIMDNIVKGKIDFYRIIRINEPEAYKQSEEESLYGTYLFWKKVFSPKYGDISPPPYGSVKIPTLLVNNTALKYWLESIDDPLLKKRLEESFSDREKTDMKTIYVPEDVVGSIGVPPEIVKIVHIRKMIGDSMNIFYLILETLNFYYNNKDGLQLISDHY